MNPIASRLRARINISEIFFTLNIVLFLRNRKKYSLEKIYKQTHKKRFRN
jgi:hypothetical protein